VHGFAVDEKASKMSKSVGNVVSPELITKGGEDLNKNPAYGVDTLRSAIKIFPSLRFLSNKMHINVVLNAKLSGGGSPVTDVNIVRYQSQQRCCAIATSLYKNCVRSYDFC